MSLAWATITLWVMCPLMSSPRMSWARALASSGLSASLTPPALPRPPTFTCALTTTGAEISRAIASACSGVSATPPGSTGTPCEANRSRAWYSKRSTNRHRSPPVTSPAPPGVVRTRGPVGRITGCVTPSEPPHCPHVPARPPRRRGAPSATRRHRPADRRTDLGRAGRTRSPGLGGRHRAAGPDDHGHRPRPGAPAPARSTPTSTSRPGVDAAHRAPALLATNGFGGTKADQADLAQGFGEQGYVTLSYTGIGFVDGDTCPITLDDREHDGAAASQLMRFLGGDPSIAGRGRRHRRAGARRPGDPPGRGNAAPSTTPRSA